MYALNHTQILGGDGGAGAKSVDLQGETISAGGDEGTGGGLVSSKISGKNTFASGSFDVKVEGKNVLGISDIPINN